MSKGNYVVLSIQNLEGIYSFAVMVNGLFRTPKINDLSRLIDWLNESSKFPFLVKLGLNTQPINSDAWLTGFLDSDGNFLITYKP